MPNRSATPSTHDDNYKTMQASHGLQERRQTGNNFAVYWDNLFVRRWESVTYLGVWSIKLSIEKWRKSAEVQGVSQLLKQSDWAQIQDFKWYHNDDYIYWKVKR